MSEQKTINLDVPHDCLTVLKMFLNRATEKGGLYSLDDAYLISVSIKRLNEFINTTNAAAVAASLSNLSEPSQSA